MLVTDPTGTPWNSTGAPTAQPVDGFIEVQNVFVGFLEEFARTEYDQAGGHNDHCEDHETADHHSVCLLSHLCPSYRLRFLAAG